MLHFPLCQRSLQEASNLLKTMEWMTIILRHNCHGYPLFLYILWIQALAASYMGCFWMIRKEFRGVKWWQGGLSHWMWNYKVEKLGQRLVWRGHSCLPGECIQNLLALTASHWSGGVKWAFSSWMPWSSIFDYKWGFKKSQTQNWLHLKIPKFDVMPHNHRYAKESVGCP